MSFPFQYDVSNLEKLFSNLGFEVEIKKNLIKTDFYTEICNFSRNRKHLDGHMMILVVLSHGRDGHIYTADGQVISTERIYENFNNQLCPLLKGKPKFFIIQVNTFCISNLWKAPFLNDFFIKPSFSFDLFCKWFLKPLIIITDCIFILILKILIIMMHQQIPNLIDNK